MPRTVGAKSTKKPKLQAVSFDDAKPIAFTAKGKDLYEKVSQRWKLDHVSEELLIIACQNISEAERCHEVLQREGYSYISRFDEPKQHPLLKQEQVFLTAASNTLAKLHLALE